MSKGLLGYYLKYLEYSGDFQLCYGAFQIPSLESLNVLFRTESICSRNRHFNKKLHFLTLFLDLAFWLLEIQIDIWKSAVTVLFFLLEEFDITPLEIMQQGNRCPKTTHPYNLVLCGENWYPV